MPKDDSILEPLHDYNSKYKALFRENATKFFDSLTKESKINVEENRATVKKYREACSKLENIKVEQKELDAEYQKIADQYGMDVAKVKEILGPQSQQLASDIHQRKIIDFLLANNE